MDFVLLKLGRGRKTVKVDETGEFPCPQCRLDRPYTLTAVHETRGVIDRYLRTPTGKFLETFVRCVVCDQQFPGEIRDRTLFRDRAREHEMMERLKQNLATRSDDES